MPSSPATARKQRVTSRSVRPEHCNLQLPASCGSRLMTGGQIERTTKAKSAFLFRMDSSAASKSPATGSAEIAGTGRKADFVFREEAPDPEIPVFRRLNAKYSSVFHCTINPSRMLSFDGDIAAFRSIPLICLRQCDNIADLNIAAGS